MITVGLLRDVRLAWRHLRASPIYALAAVVTLALAIGANSAIFSAVSAVLLKPLPVRQPDRIVIAWETDPSRNLPVIEVTYRNFERWRAASRGIAPMSVMGSSSWPVVLEGRGEPAKLATVSVSASFFDTLGAPPMLGRTLRADDDRANAAPVVILSHGTWVRRFGADPRVIGTTVTLSDVRTTIVGVMPPGFDVPRGTELWKPVMPVFAKAQQGSAVDVLEEVGVLLVLGRMRDGVTIDAATRELDAIARRVTIAPVRPSGVPSVTVTPLLDHTLGPVRGALWWLLGAVGALLLIACANVSGLMLTRASLRRREQAIRLALGANATALARLWAIESVLLSIAGGVAGLLLARWIAAAIVALAPDDIPRLSEIAIDLPVAAFTIAIVLATALLCGLGPVLHARASNVVEALNDAARGMVGVRTLRARSLLVMVQIGLAVVLLIAAGLIVRSFSALRALDFGFDPAGVVTIDIQPHRESTPAAVNRWMRDLLSRIEPLPGVDAAGAVSLRPFALGVIGQDGPVVIDGEPATRANMDAHPPANYEVATPGYFRAMRIGLVRGRLFDARDDEHAPRVCVIGETTARRLWPGQEAIGRRISLPEPSSTGWQNTWRTVVGIVRDVRYRGLDDVRMDVYDPAAQAEYATESVVIRTTANPVAVASAVQAEARRDDPRVLVDRVTTMEAIVGRAVAPWRFSVWLFAVFAVLAFVLSTVGLFSVVSLDAMQRSREFAVRLALGAQRRDIVTRMLVSASGRVVVGIAVGVVVAAVASQWIRSLLFAIDPLDAPTYVAVVALVAGVVAIASYLPARRASRVDPVVLLRRD